MIDDFSALQPVSLTVTAISHLLYMAVILCPRFFHPEPLLLLLSYRLSLVYNRKIFFRKGCDYMKLSLFSTLRGYRKEYLPKDIFSGIIIAAVSIPISMGYAQISGIPAVYGLYGSVLPILFVCSIFHFKTVYLRS